MNKYGTQKGGKEIFGNISKAFGFEPFSVTNMDDDEFRQVQGSSHVARKGHTEEFGSEISELQGAM